MDIEELFSFDNLYDSLWKCCRSVGWKNRVKHFKLNSEREVVKLQKALYNGTYKPKKPTTIQIYYPKKREAMSINFVDRMVQRTINDIVLYPNASKTLIVDNCACQKGKGPQFCRKRIIQHMRNHYINNGKDGWLVQIDIHGYYPSMEHDKVKACFRKLIEDDWLYDMICESLDSQESDGVGYSPGSQMIQIAGIALLNPLDHYIKEQLHVKHYVRYMDDFWILVKTKEEAEHILDVVKRKLYDDYHLEVNPKKTHVQSLSKGFDFLGFRWRLSESGKVIQNVLPENYRHQHNKMIRMAHKGIDAETTKDSLICWAAHINEGQNKKAQAKMWKLFYELYPDYEYGKEANNAQV